MEEQQIYMFITCENNVDTCY